MIVVVIKEGRGLKSAEKKQGIRQRGKGGL